MSTRRERILLKLNPNLLKMTPKLSGDTGSVIDLNSEDSLEDGAKKLMMRFFRNQDLCERNKRNLAQSETEFTVSTAKYNENDEICELISETLTLPAVRNDGDVSERPGKRLQQLKMELQEKMSAKWLVEYNKRVSENKKLTEPKRKRKKKKSKKEEESSEEEDEESDGVIEKLDKRCDDGEDGDDANDADIEYEEDEEDGEDVEDDVSFLVSERVINKNDCEDKEDDMQQDNNYNDEEEGCSLVPAYQPGGGMLYGGSELTQEEEGLPQSLLSPSIRFSLSQCKISQSLNDQTPKKSAVARDEERSILLTEKMKLFSQNSSDCFDLNDAFEFCSGKFPEGGDENEVNNKGNDDSHDDGFMVEEESESQVEDLESKKKRKNIITFDDSEAEEEKQDEGLKADDDDDDDDGSHLAHPKLLTDDENEESEEKTELKKKTRKNLHFSDEEEPGNECEEQENDLDETSQDEGEEPDVGDECEQRSIHYDSEENEIINPKEFFEKEAELSGSEWSGDEDERGLDKFDAEEGDADVLDEDQVRSQLERIHLRRVLDDDAREVRLIQEILFEDGDLYTDGKVRERKFKWKNLGAFDDNDNEEGPKEDAGNSSEDEGAEEEQMRKKRHEKELFLMEKMAKKNNEELSSDEEIVENFHTVKVTSAKTLLKPSGNSEKTDNSKTVTNYTEIAKTTKLSSARGSFLTRNEQFLSRLAKATSGITDNVLGPKNSKNFVFVTKSPEKINPEKSTACKRQIEQNCSRREKKVKLLPPEIDTGPSILDLLA